MGGQARMNNVQGAQNEFRSEMEVIIKAGHEQMNTDLEDAKTTMGAGQEKMEAVMSELEDIINNQEEGVLASFDQRLQSLFQKPSSDNKKSP